MISGSDQNGDESGKGMVSGRNTVLRRFGIYLGENTGIGYADTYRRRNSPRQGARVLLMDGTAVESAFALLLTKVTKPPYPAKISYNRHNWRKYKLCAISGTLFRRRGEEHNDENNDQRHDWSWIAGS